MISVNDLKTGLTLELDNGLWSVVEFLHVKPGKGAAFVRTKLKNVESGNVIEKTFRAGEKVAKAMLDRREMQYLYKEGADYVMMDNETYDQLHLTEDQIGDGLKSLTLRLLKKATPLKEALNQLNSKPALLSMFRSSFLTAIESALIQELMNILTAHSA